MGDIIHHQRSMLYPSRRDTARLAIAVEERFLTVCARYLQVTGAQLVPPEELNADMLLWRQLRVRHKKQDYRNTYDEAEATKRIAQWTLDVNNELCGQPKQTIDFDRGV